MFYSTSYSLILQIRSSKYVEANLLIYSKVVVKRATSIEMYTVLRDCGVPHISLLGHIGHGVDLGLGNLRQLLIF